MQTAEAVVFVHPIDWNLEGPLFTPQKNKTKQKTSCWLQPVYWRGIVVAKKKPGKKQTI